MRIPRYNEAENLTGTMTEFGSYRLSYTPPTECVEASVDMTISSEADLAQMLELFECFLGACGYVLNGELQIVEPEVAYDKDYWQEKYFDLLNSGPETNNGIQFITTRGSQGVDFVPYSLADDILSWGSSGSEE